ncbi:DUF6279 family lipoprotein [Umboniibacter marinipuniceus]|uniref:Lipoprotein n=1 Tax=Umboniibacter marinipuniceus TaxID=569599 RepID=A0A3M0A466_9GAMM|nr:DUF6279 family lipoprotein [Umboniibacter marinipuniceus]RMA79417.1 hypothetical protein DFR27_1858 [Umboniibacter marinipuniceus]
MHTSRIATRNTPIADRISDGWRRLRLGTRAALLSVVVLLTGCTQAFLYDFIPRYILWEMDEFVTLNNEQEDELMVLMTDALEVNRNEHMPLYYNFLSDVETEIMLGDVTPDDVKSWYTRIVTYRAETLEWLAPQGAQFLIKLSDEQHEELLANLQRGLNDDDESLAEADVSERKARWIEGRIEFVEEMVGELSEAQKTALMNSVTDQQDTTEQWMTWRHRWLDEFSSALKDRDESRLMAVMAYPETLYSPEYKAMKVDNRQRSFGHIASFLGDLTDQQRAQLVTQLDKWRQLFVAISAGG